MVVDARRASISASQNAGLLGFSPTTIAGLQRMTDREKMPYKCMEKNTFLMSEMMESK